MNRYVLDLPVVEASTSPREALTRMRERGVSGLVYFDKGAPFVVHSKDVVKGIVRGRETIARVHHVRIGREKVAVNPFKRARALPRPRVSFIRINEDNTAAIIVGSESKKRWFGGPPLNCQCLGRRKHEAPHDEHGSGCLRDGQPFDCSR